MSLSGGPPSEKQGHSEKDAGKAGDLGVGEAEEDLWIDTDKFDHESRSTAQDEEQCKKRARLRDGSRARRPFWIYSLLIDPDREPFRP